MLYNTTAFVTFTALTRAKTEKMKKCIHLLKSTVAM